MDLQVNYHLWKGVGGGGGLNTKSDNDQFDKTMKAITLDEE